MDTSRGPLLGGHNQPEPAAALAFYQELFGSEFEDVAPPDQGTTYAIGARCVATTRSRIHRSHRVRPPWRNGTPTYSVEDADKTTARAHDPSDGADENRRGTERPAAIRVIADPEGAVLLHLAVRATRGPKWSASMAR